MYGRERESPADSRQTTPLSFYGIYTTAERREYSQTAKISSLHNRQRPAIHRKIGDFSGRGTLEVLLNEEKQGTEDVRSSGGTRTTSNASRPT
ncbi:hypothetical protein [Haladaptatus litoreus]|uniref:hypothetical protein n=1 Tax=Haladaptatus litoreus TaxID=553468 RepID=UPI000970A1FF|nr:hypothetical protein [Haladaptatus litoreus]